MPLNSKSLILINDKLVYLHFDQNGGLYHIAVPVFEYNVSSDNNVISSLLLHFESFLKNPIQQLCLKNQLNSCGTHIKL